MHAVATGAAGFIGGHLAAELLTRDYRVTAIDRQPDPGLGTHRYVALDLADLPAVLERLTSTRAQPALAMR